jgi:hypothetical protein
LERSGCRVWKRWIGRRVLDSKCERRDGRGVERMGWNEDPRPAFRIRMLILGVWVEARVDSQDRRSLAEDSGDERESVKGIMSSLLPSAMVRALRSSVAVVKERIVAMTVVWGRRRRDATRPRPIPKQVNS